MRLDVYLAENALAKSRSYASELVKKGLVTVDGVVVNKPSFDIEIQEVKVLGELHSFVGRGGVKLDGAIIKFGVDVTDFVCIDVGASTGGFTDCLLKRGAKKVYAVDSGHGQLDKKLMDDERVINLEGFNARDISPETIGDVCDMAVCDLSFISQTYVTKQVHSVLKENGLFISLIKPQFECGREALGKGGIVKDRKYHVNAIEKVCTFAFESGFECISVMPSDILGGDGNREYMALFVKKEDPVHFPSDRIKEVVL